MTSDSFDLIQAGRDSFGQSLDLRVEHDDALNSGRQRDRLSIYQNYLALLNRDTRLVRGD